MENILSQNTLDFVLKWKLFSLVQKVETANIKYWSDKLLSTQR